MLTWRLPPCQYKQVGRVGAVVSSRSVPPPREPVRCQCTDLNDRRDISSCVSSHSQPNAHTAAHSWAVPSLVSSFVSTCPPPFSSISSELDEALGSDSVS